MMTALVIILILTVAVVIHELAHYLNARSVGLPVRAFSVGFGPILFRRQWRGTEWRLSAIPLGGYVDLPGLAAEPDAHGNMAHPTTGFATLTLGQKLWVLVGGVIANFLLAIVLMATVISADPTYRTITAGIEVETYGTIIQTVAEGSVAERLGIQPGDVVLELNGVSNPDGQQVRQMIQQSSELRLVLDRNGERIDLETPWPPAGLDGPPLLGVGLAPAEVELPPALSFPQALVEAGTFFVRVVPDTIGAFGRGVAQTVTGQQSEELAGPVRIVSYAGQAARAGLLPVLLFAALINFSLAVFNLLPVPALDGGRMLLATIVSIRGKPFKPGQEEFIHFIGFVALMGFMILITFSEVGELFRQG
jgi:regulator of sigma E protease